MGKKMCKFNSSPLEIEYSNENKLNFLFLKLFNVHIFLSIFTLHNILFIFKIVILHNLTFSFVIANLPTKLSFPKKLYSSNKQLYYVTTCRILWEWVQEDHLLWDDTFVASLLILLALLCLLVFWTSLRVIDC
jgi:hypothetical protein